jgi:hypothetical protein
MGLPGLFLLTKAVGRLVPSQEEYLLSYVLSKVWSS